MSEEKKQRLKEYQKICREAKKSQYTNKQIKQFFNYDLINYAIYLAVHY